MCSLIINAADYFRHGISRARPVIIVGAAVCGRERMAWYWAVYTTGRERGTEIQFTCKLNQLFFSFFYIATKSAEVLFFKSNISCQFPEETTNWVLTDLAVVVAVPHLLRKCESFCATIAASRWRERLVCGWHFGQRREMAHRKKNISSRLRTRLETHLVFEDTFGLGVRSILVLFLGKPQLLTWGISTTCQCLLRMSDLCFRHLLPPQSLSALSSYCAPCYHVPKTSV